MVQPADPWTARLQRALDGSHDGFWERNLRTDESWYSDSFRALFGFAPDELPNDRNVVNARIHRDDIGGFVAAYEQAIRDIAPFAYEVRFLDRHERWRWVRGRGRVWAGDDGRAAIIAGTVSDVTGEKQALLALERMTERFEDAVAAADEGIFERIDGEDEIYVSDRLCSLLGHRPGRLPATRSALLELVHPDDLPRHLALAERSIATLRKFTSVVRMRCRSGGYRWFRQQSVPKRLADGRVRITGVIADIHDQVTARDEVERHRARLEELVGERTARLEAALAEAERRRHEAQRADEAKSRFVAHMSHELRTPLNGVLGLIDLARQGATDSTQRRFLEMALQSGRTLLQVINDVLDLSRLDAAGLTLTEAPFDVARALAEVMRGVMPLVRDKGLSMRFDWTGEPTWVVGDEARVRQIVTNLVGNAAKFTEHGHVALYGELVDAGDSCCTLTVRVDDTGPGIDADRVDSLFGAFVQGDQTLSRRHGGAGLGLTIGRRLARTMGGDIAARSTPGAGSEFTLTLPLRRAADPDPLPVPATGLAWLVYRRDDIGRWLQRRVERFGWTAALVTDPHAVAAAALALPAAERPQLVVFAEHVLEPDPDLAAVRAALPEARVSLLVRPDWNQPALERQALALGMQLDVMPLTPRDLRRMLQPLAVPAPAAAGVSADTAAPAGDVLLVEDNPVNRMIGEQFLRTLGLPVRCAGDGREAIAACAAEAPALVLMDLQMPVLDGLGAARELRARQQRGELPPFPIVALTAHAMAKDRDACAAAGMDGFLTKPLLLETLRDELARWLPLRAGA